MYRILFPILCFFLLSPTACTFDDDDGQPTDERALPQLIVPTVLSIEEGAGASYALEIPIRVEGLSLTNVTLAYRTESGTALAGEDFVAVESGRLLFAPSETEKSITVTIVPDASEEADETFQIVFFDVKNAVATNAAITVEIKNDDEGQNLYNIPQTGYVSADSYDGMALVWEEQFTGDDLNEADWNYEIGTGSNGWGNNELQYYQRENTILSDGHLIIEAREEAVNGSNYTSSRLTTMNKKEFKYGRIDMRAALPEGQGIWPALWMLGADFQQVSWPSCGEIDIMELVGNLPNRVYGTAHYGVSGTFNTSKGSSTTLSGGAKFSEEFHVFSIDWQEDSITWLMDDQPFFTLTPADIDGNVWRFNDEFFFIANLAVGGNWPGSPDASTVFPQRLIVDYIRVFQ